MRGSIAQKREGCESSPAGKGRRIRGGSALPEVAVSVAAQTSARLLVKWRLPDEDYESMR